MLNLPVGDSINLARLLNSQVSNDGNNHSTLNVWVKVPMEYQETMNDDVPVESAWAAWDRFRTTVSIDRRLFPILTIPVDLPDYDVVKRWLGEPVKAIILSEENFITNHKGYPVLPKPVQQVVHDFHDRGAHVILNCSSGRNPDDYSLHRQYIGFLYARDDQEWDENMMSKYTKGYEDYLQSPLQPLMDNLEANTYEVFEKDPIKYQLYREAVEKALIDRIPEEEKETKTV